MSSKTIPQLAEDYNREVRRHRRACAIGAAWRWLAAALLILALTLGAIAAFRATLTSIMIAKANSPTAILAARGW